MIRVTTPIFFAALAASILCGCSRGVRTAPVVSFKGSNTSIVVEGIDECDDRASTELRIDPQQPLVVIVHGCNASGGRFRALAQVFEAHDQQTVCFNYDDRERMVRTSAKLTRALDALEDHITNRPITVLGHSQGGLVSRRALVEQTETSTEGQLGVRYRLVTVSSPFNGIEASSHCSSMGFHIATLGVSALLCQFIAGNKWDEIHPRADFMRFPGNMLEGVDKHLEVVTDERDSCRREDNDGECVEDDFVFTVEEQMNPTIEQDLRVEIVEVKAGHVEIVGDEGTPPMKLIELLQNEGILAPTPADEQEKLAALLRALF